MKVKFTTNIDKELLTKIKLVAVEKGLNVNEIIESQLEKYLENDKEEERMLYSFSEERYEVRFEELKKEGDWKYFITGSPTHLRWYKEIKGDTLEEIWEQLLELGELDEDRLDADFGYEDENGLFHWDCDLPFDEAIEEYLSDGNNFYYRKISWLD